MEKALNLVKEFHETFGISISEKPELPVGSVRKLQMDLLKEEYKEYLDAEVSGDILRIADELADLIYMALGTAIRYGIPMDKVFEAVHKNNMTKLDSDGNPVVNENGKVIKPEGFEPVDLSWLLEGKEGESNYVDAREDGQPFMPHVKH